MTPQELFEMLVDALGDMAEVLRVTPLDGEPNTIAVETTSGAQFFITVEVA